MWYGTGHELMHSELGNWTPSHACWLTGEKSLELLHHWMCKVGLCAVWKYSTSCSSHHRSCLGLALFHSVKTLCSCWSIRREYIISRHLTLSKPADLISDLACFLFLFLYHELNGLSWGSCFVSFLTCHVLVFLSTSFLLHARGEGGGLPTTPLLSPGHC